MKGTIKLAPIENPVEGMQVVGVDFYKDRIGILVPGGSHSLLVDWGNDHKKYIYKSRYGGWNHTINYQNEKYALQQIVVEYYEPIPAGKDNRGFVKYGWLNKTICVDPNQWKIALPFIGSEVNFDIIYGISRTVKENSSKDKISDISYAKIHTVAKAIEETSEEECKDYIEEKNLKAKKFISEHGLPDGWGSTPVYPDIEQMAEDAVIKENIDYGDLNEQAEIQLRDVYIKGFKACAKMYGIKLENDEK